MTSVLILLIVVCSIASAVLFFKSIWLNASAQTDLIYRGVNLAIKGLENKSN